MLAMGLESYSVPELASLVGGRLYGTTAPETRVRQVVMRDQDVTTDCLFVAVQGARHDGHEYVGRAFERGACVALVSDAGFQKLQGSLKSDAALIQVSDTRLALSHLADVQFESPSQKLRTIGITGTNGKTTTNWMLFHLLNLLGEKSVRLGTLGIAYHDRVVTADSLTTPDALTLQRVLSESLHKSAHAAVLEVSSHALHQLRVEHIAFDVAVFTNLTRDHLDYHDDMESYYIAKQHLFELVSSSQKSTRVAVINRDCPYGLRLCSEASKLGLKDFSFGREPESTVRIKDFSQSVRGSRVLLEYRGKTHEVHSGFIGAHNAHNIAAVMASLVALGYEADRCVQLFKQVPPVPGRLEAVYPDNCTTANVFVDYAHTPDALERVLECLRELTPGKLWVVFGCGGDRDRGKRPLMAEVANRLADTVVVTSDNPRTEDPQTIIDDIMVGETGLAIQKKGFTQIDRRVAIHTALTQAAPEDVILIAGKGHEQYQVLGTTKHHFSDQEEVRNFSQRRQPI